MTFHIKANKNYNNNVNVNTVAQRVTSPAAPHASTRSRVPTIGYTAPSKAPDLVLQMDNVLKAIPYNNQYEALKKSLTIKIVKKIHEKLDKFVSNTANIHSDSDINYSTEELNVRKADEIFSEYSREKLNELKLYQPSCELCYFS